MTRYELAQGKRPPSGVVYVRKVPGHRYRSSTGWHETQREEITWMDEPDPTNLFIDNKHRASFDAAYEVLRNMDIPTAQFQLEINKLLRKYGDTCAPGPDST